MKGGLHAFFKPKPGTEQEDGTSEKKKKTGLNTFFKPKTQQPATADASTTPKKTKVSGKSTASNKVENSTPSSTKSSAKKRIAIDNEDEEDSPSIKPKSRRVRQVVDSDSEDEVMQEPAKQIKTPNSDDTDQNKPSHKTTTKKKFEPKQSAKVLEEKQSETNNFVQSTERGMKSEQASSKSPEPPSPSLAKSTQVSPAKSKAKPTSSISHKKSHEVFGDDSDDDEVSEDEEDDVVADTKDVKVKSLAKTAKLSTDNIPKPFDPIKNACWKQGEPVPYRALVEVLEAIEQTTKRIEIQSLLANLFRSVIALTPEDLLTCVYLSCNQIAPAFAGIEIGVGDSFIVKVIMNSSGKSKASIMNQYEEIGDLGSVAELSRTKQTTLFGFKSKALTAREVLEGFRVIANISGAKSQDKKIGQIQKLFVRAEKKELKYLVRGLQGKLRIGLAEQSVLVALANSLVLTPPSATLPPPVLDVVGTISNDQLLRRLEQSAETIKQVYSELPTYEEIIPALLDVGLEGIHDKCHIRAGIPLKPMLAKPTKGISEVLDRFSGIEFTCEYKYDGERAQIHLMEDGTIKIYSRNSEDNTTKYPDVIEVLPNTLKEGVTSCIIDSEVVAWDVGSKKLLPFQVLSTRARKNVEKEKIEVQVIICAFDIIFLNGKSLLKDSFKSRREKLHANFSEVEGRFVFAKGFDGKDAEDIQTFLTDSVEHNCEGLMVKTLEVDATYEPSRRSLNWLKLKKDYMEGITDSLDLVPIGAFMGKGKRTGTYGAYLLACYDEDEGEFQAICKIGTGFSDEQLQVHYKALKETIVPKKPANVLSALDCDVWFNPGQVWEVLAADLSISPVHLAAKGKVDPQKGIALRFPRFIRIREDKNIEQATNADQVADMYLNQGLATKTNGGMDEY